MKTSFYKRFWLEVSLIEGKRMFLNRVNDRIFSNLEENVNKHQILVRVICDRLGEKYSDFIFETNSREWEVVKRIESITKRDFEMTLYVLETMCKLKEELVWDILNHIRDCIDMSIKYDWINLWIRFHNWLFYPAGDEILDKEIIEASLDNIEWFKAKIYYTECLKNYLQWNKKWAIEDCYETLEKLSQEILQNTKNLKDNRENILKCFGWSEWFSNQRSKIVNNLYDYLNDHRHTTKDKTNENIDELETEATIYQTWLIINLLIKKYQSKQ